MKKAICVVLATVLALSLFTACGGSNQNQSNEPAANTSPTGSTAPAGNQSQGGSSPGGAAQGNAGQGGAGQGGAVQGGTGQGGAIQEDDIIGASTSGELLTYTTGTNFDADIVITQANDMIHWDPITSSDVPNSTILFCVYSRLFKSDKDYMPEPELCEEYTMISDNEWHFKIYDNIKCHDGSIITADDVVFSLQRAKESATAGGLFRSVDAITKVDDLTISITTYNPYPGLLTALSHVGTCIVPIDYAQKAIADDDWSQPVGSGRYKFESREIGYSVKVVRFDDYFMDSDRALNKSLTFRIIPEGTNRTIAVETGEVDISVDFETIDYDRVVNNPDLKLWESYTTTVYYLGMDVTLPWLDNPLVRQAVNFAVDRDACLEVAFSGKGYVLYNNVGFASSILGAVNNPLDHYQYDPQKAKDLMAQAGCPGFETEIYVFNEVCERIALVCQAYLGEIGIKAEIQRVEPTALYAKSNEHGTPMQILVWSCYWDPDLFVGRRFTEAGFGAVNRSWYSSQELDAMLVEGRSYFTDAERAEVYKKMQEFMVFESPEADLFVINGFALSRNGLKGVIVGSEKVSYLYQLHY